MAQKQTSLISGGGIMRYFNDYKSSLSFKPGHVIVFSLIVIIGVLMLHLMG